MNDEWKHRGVTPSPTPTTFRTATGVATAPTGEQVRFGLLNIATPSGEHTTFWDAASLLKLADELAALADEVAKPVVQTAGPQGLVLPTSRTNGGKRR